MYVLLIKTFYNKKFRIIFNLAKINRLINLSKMWVHFFYVLKSCWIRS